jgi:hypothetical protein
MKTVRQHLIEKLTPEIYDKAMANIVYEPGLDVEVSSPSGAVASAFVWGMSPEGYDFWEDVFDNLLRDVDIYVRK